MKKYSLVLLVFLVYCLLRLPGLTQLPIFADEAIYLRWTQLIISDARQYWLFPLNDGKTPLFVWLAVPFVKLIEDPLHAGRLLVVVGGAVQLFATWLLLRELKVGKPGQLYGVLAVMIAPFWYFHHRIALMDGWLTAWLTIAALAILKAGNQSTSLRKQVTWLLVGVGAVWAGLMTKVPFVLGIPALLCLSVLTNKETPNWVQKLGKTILIIGGGSGLFLLLALSPVFPQLVMRGGDFLFSWSEIVGGRWQETLPSIPNYLSYFVSYAGWGMFVAAAIAFIRPQRRREALAFGLSWLFFCAPIWLLGKVVYPRYLFPSMLFLTVLGSIGADQLWQWSKTAVQTKNRQLAIKVLYGLLLAQLALGGLRFIWPSISNPAAIPFVPSDRAQYLTTWSAGYGTIEVYQWLADQSQTGGNQLWVATEGSFGSLPDGLLLYNFKKPLPNVWIEGIGYPITTFPTSLAEKIEPSDRVLLVINSDRLQWELRQTDLVKEFCRPDQAPCLQVWDITNQYELLKKP